MKVTTILIGALGVIMKVLIKGLVDVDIREQVETIQMTLIRSAGKLRRILET